MTRPLDRVEAVLPTALALVGAVRDDPDQVASILQRADLPAIAIALAALVPDDKTAAELLAWHDPDGPARAARTREQNAARQLRRLRANAAPTRDRQHGTHSGFNGHRNHNEEPCEPCRLAERIYQRERNQRRREQQRQQEAS